MAKKTKTAPKKVTRNILIRDIDKETATILDKFKLLEHEKTDSKAVLLMIDKYEHLNEKINTLEEHLSVLIEKNTTYKKRLDNLIEALEGLEKYRNSN